MRRGHGAGVGLDERPERPRDSDRAVPVAPRPEPLRTEFPFVLPRGYVDGSGNVHRDGGHAAGDRPATSSSRCATTGSGRTRRT